MSADDFSIVRGEKKRSRRNLDMLSLLISPHCEAPVLRRRQIQTISTDRKMITPTAKTDARTASNATLCFDGVLELTLVTAAVELEDIVVTKCLS